MRPKGWKNDPRWVAWYQSCNERYEHRAFLRLQMETQATMLRADMRAAQIEIMQMPQRLDS